ncbi:unnamed protein product [Meloidogyne enterolobii]|uniref:Uncharacterized protein n=1 Tax=Meloidogyne enterolobii TaxID=390850 RepID=A0ACB0ZHM6_MELEN
MHLRQVVGKFEHKRKESEKLLTELGGGEALVRQFRTMSINTRKQANFYKKALNNLMTKGKQSLQSSRRRPTLASTTSSVSGKLKNQNLNKSQSSLNNFNLRKEIPSELNLKNSKRRASSLENSKASKSVNNEPTNLKNVENESLGILLDSEGPPSINNTNFNEKSPSNQPTPQSNRSLITCVRRTQRSNSENSKIGFPKKEEFEEQNVEEEEENEKKSDEDLDFKHFEDSEEEGEVEEDEKEGKEDEEDEEEEEDRDEESIHQVSEESDEKEIEDMENEETHLNALYRLISSHILRQQMCKVREERDHYSKQMVVGILQQEQQNYYW